ncbi:NAD(P)-binding protein [Didymella exigua CBS 183.55]|uniref:NAD(P)-binding protein n=1 Tax=Didymella exigua CBS 183.55 TaxID=1150837 RepID=A0A6A5RVQ6_9PLEO|nr:NAD(P)-binding protein [Didymella exigua CBS 183.55]KAF1932555.1 NAD(P)-binding protein [Didymella exigua CBS 183.55]
MAPFLAGSSETNGSSHEAYLKAPDFQKFDHPPRVMVIGAGSRGTAYAEAALEGTNAIIAAVCEPTHSKREAFGKRFIWHGKLPAQPGEHFSTWQQWVEWEEENRQCEAHGEGGPTIDVVFVCVLDEMHEEVVRGIAHLGVHICCEKPLSTRLDSCMRMYKALNDAKKSTVAAGNREPVFGICHVLRYSPHNMLLRHLVRDKNVIGDILSIEHCEPVGWWHFSHSYVRGNWRKESTSAPSLLTKSCHDIDFLMWMLCTPSLSTSPPHLPSSITSAGSLKYFRKSRKPAEAGSATNCLSCAYEPSCSYSAKKIYLENQLAQGNADWPVKIVNPEIEDLYKTKGVEAASDQLLTNLAEDYDSTTPLEVRNKRNYFGRCVWESDNDVCDDQVVTLTWDDDGEDASRGAKTALFHMIAHTEKQCERRGRIYGTKGEIEYDSTTISVHDFASKKTTKHVPHAAGGGHGGGDAGLVRQFLMAVDAVEEGEMSTHEAQRTFLGCDLEEAFRSHAVVFAAEDARTKKQVVDWGAWWKEHVESKVA